MSKMTTAKLARMNQREFLALWARIAAHEEALRSLHGGLDYGVRTLADGLELALVRLAALGRRAKRTRTGPGQKRGGA